MITGKTLTLVPISVYKVTASVDERGPQGLVGYYRELTSANLASKGAGWYGSNGEVTPATVYQDPITRIVYTLVEHGKLKDVESEEVTKMLDNIKSKLTPEEWEFYNKVHKQK